MGRLVAGMVTVLGSDPAAHHYGGGLGGDSAAFGRAAANGVRNESRAFGGGQVRDLGADGYRHYVAWRRPAAAFGVQGGDERVEVDRGHPPSTAASRAARGSNSSAVTWSQAAAWRTGLDRLRATARRQDGYPVLLAVWTA